MTKEKYMALADFQSLWTNTIKPYIVAGFIAVTAVESGATPKLVLQDGTLINQSTFIAATEKGANNGVATLGNDGKVPSSQLPSFVDDVIDLLAMTDTAPSTCAKGDLYYNTDSKKIFEATAANTWSETGTDPEGGKIYINLTDSNTYRWSGTTMAQIAAGLALGETQGTAYEGSKGKANADAIAAHTGNNDIHVTTQNKSDWNAKYDKPSGGIPKSDLAQAVQDVLDAAPVAITANPESLTSAQCEALTVGDQVIKEDASGKHVYTVTYKSATGMCLTYGDAENIETIAYDKADDTWSKTDKTVTGIATAATKAASAIQSVKVNGSALTPDANKAVDVEVPERVTSTDLAGFVV